jgi:selenocysteine lyase/cysteine desulfurase
MNIACLKSATDPFSRWLYTPRSAAVLYVPKRNQHLLRTTLPTSWGFIPGTDSPATRASVLQDANAVKTKTPFEELFEFVATSDDSAYICVPAALKFRQEVCGGEDAIISYCTNLANEAADAVAAILGTDVMQEPDLKRGETSNMRQCMMTTVRLPIGVADDGSNVPGALITVNSEEAARVFGWIQTTLMEKHDTFVPVFRHGPWLWTRLSAQIFLEKSDFEWLGGILRDMCDKVAGKEYAKL